jgi:hypothetical protein
VELNSRQPVPRPQPSDSERTYLCQRLDRLNSLIADLEQQATFSRGMRAQLLLARAEKHRLRADRIRAYLRIWGV